MCEVNQHFIMPYLIFRCSMNNKHATSDVGRLLPFRQPVLPKWQLLVWPTGCSAEPGRLLRWLRLLVAIIVPRIVVFSSKNFLSLQNHPQVCLRPTSIPEADHLLRLFWHILKGSKNWLINLVTITGSVLTQRAMGCILKVMIMFSFGTSQTHGPAQMHLPMTH